MAGPLSTGGERTFAYDVGDISYWPPNNDVAIFYDSDKAAVPPPGLI